MNKLFTLTSFAQTKLTELLKSKLDGTKLRISVKGGGCSGFKYDYQFDDITSAEEDLYFGFDSCVVIDNISINMLENATLDYEESLGSSGFVIKNLNATSRCGCGQSFSI